MSSHEENNEASTTSAAAASSSTNYDDATIAQTLQCYEQLTFTYSFPPEVAQVAMEAVGPDPVTCYNYILDQGLAEDGGGPVVPKTDCPHMEHHVCIAVEDLKKRTWNECSHFRMELRRGGENRTGGGGGGGLKGDYTEEGSCPQGQNWICLECNVARCSRYVNGHGKAHWEATKASPEERGVDGTGHCVAISMEDLSIWCYECNSYLHHERLKPFMKRMEELKFNTEEDEDQGDKDEKCGEGEDGDQNGKDDECDNKDDNASKTDESENDGMSNGSLKSQKGDEQTRGTKRTSPDDVSNEDSDENDSADDGIYHQHSHIQNCPVVPHPNLPKSIKDLAAFIKSDQCQSIIVLSGAGMSRSSGSKYT